MEERRVVNDKAWNDLKNIKTTQTERKVEKDVLKVENLENIVSTFTFNRTLFSFFVSEYQFSQNTSLVLFMDSV